MADKNKLINKNVNLKKKVVNDKISPVLIYNGNQNGEEALFIIFNTHTAKCEKT